MCKSPQFTRCKEIGELKMQLTRNMVGSRILYYPDKLSLKFLKEATVLEITEKGNVKLKLEHSSVWYAKEEIEKMELVEHIPKYKIEDLVDLERNIVLNKMKTVEKFYKPMECNYKLET